jgi:hypothetical protein
MVDMGMKRMLKRALGVALSVLLAFALVPSGALAVEGEQQQVSDLAERTATEALDDKVLQAAASAETEGSIFEGQDAADERVVREAPVSGLVLHSIGDDEAEVFGGWDALVEKLGTYLVSIGMAEVALATLVVSEQRDGKVFAVFEMDDADGTWVGTRLEAGELVFETVDKATVSGSGSDETEAMGKPEAGEPSLVEDENKEAGSEEENEAGRGVSGGLVPMDIVPMAAPPSSLTGRFNLRSGFSVTSSYAGSFPGTITIPGYEVVSFGDNSAGDNGRIPCISPGAANWGDASNGDARSGTVSATWSQNDTAAGIAWYWIQSVSPDWMPAPPGTTNGVQYLGSAWLAIRWSFDASLHISKSSTNLAIVADNQNYSFEGIRYGVYGSDADAQAQRDAYAWVTLHQEYGTDGQPYGYGSTSPIPEGVYYVREWDGPDQGGKGYAIDQVVHTIQVGSPYSFTDLDGTGANVLYVQDKPQGDPAAMLVQKLDAGTGKAWGEDDPEGQRLAGAQFTARYYAGYYDTVAEAEASGMLARTWILETEAGGRAFLDSRYLVSGSDALFMSDVGNPTIPLGTILIQETKAPTGYMLPSPNTVSLQQVKLNTNTRQVIRLNPIIVSEQPHELKLVKKDAKTGAVLPGAEFVLYKESAKGKGDWTRIVKKVTGADGSFSYSPIETGSYKLVEAKAPEGYQLPSEAGLPTEIAFEIDGLTRERLITATDYARGDIEIRKFETGIDKPLPNTEFAIYSHPVVIANGEILANTADISATSVEWVEVGRAVSDGDGKVVFNLPYGYYKIVETRPNPEYASYKESGGTDRFLKLDKHTTDEAQIFENDIIQISCEVYKKTIAVTSSSLDGSGVNAVNNVGHEEYLYHFGARSTSNVWADEFIVTDDLTYVTSKGYRMTTLWTGTSPAGMDFDNKMAILYKTNKTSEDEQVVFTYNPLAGNPDNPNNPERNIIYSNEPGWRIWAEELPVTNQSRLDVSELVLDEDEYIIGLKVAYGGVIKDFFTGTGWQDAEDPKTKKDDKVTPMAMTSPDAVLSDWYYAVVATNELLPADEMGDETVMRASVSTNIGRNNGVLTDEDDDEVETRVIQPFQIPTTSNGIRGGLTPVSTAGHNTPASGLPRTGDSVFLAAVAGMLAACGIVLLAIDKRRKKRKLADRVTQFARFENLE